MPCGDDIALLLSQPQITGADIKKILRNRGVMADSSDKAEVSEHLIYSYLSASEINELLQLVADREENFKLQSSSYHIELKEGVSFLEVIPKPEELDFENTTKDAANNYKIKNSGVFKKSDKGSYELNYSIVRNQVSSSWITSKAEFTGKVVLNHLPDESKMEVRLYHSSPETQKVNDLCKKKVISICENKNFLKKESEESITFGDFSNEQRVLFFNKFTSSFDAEDFEFKKLGAVTYRVDDVLTPETELRLAWMKDGISKSTVSGDGVYNTFLFKEKSCWRYLKMWVLELRFSVETIAFKGTTNVKLEFEGYTRTSDQHSKLVICVDPIKSTKYDGSTEKVKAKILERLNSYAGQFFKEISEESE